MTGPNRTDQHGETGERSSESVPVRSRRAVLRGTVGAVAGGAVAASGAMAGTGVAQAGRAASPPTRGPFATPGRPSRAAYRALAAVERRAAARSGATFDRTVNAVDYLDLGPKTPVDEALVQADAAGRLDGVRLDFPTGVYRISDGFTIAPDGAFGMVGHDATFRLDRGLRCEGNVDVSRGVFRDFTIDQRAGTAAFSFHLRTDDHVLVRDVTYRGPVEAIGGDENQGALLRPVAATPTASVRIRGFRALGGTTAGSHPWVGAEPPPPGFVAGGVAAAFVGSATEGVVQFVDADLRGWENGLYASRTPGAVQVVGGRFVNNNNTAVRISGAESFCDGASILLDSRRWPANSPGEFKIGEIQGVTAVRSETGRLNKEGARLRNLDVRGLAMGKCPGLVVYRGSAGTGSMTNCRLVDDIDGAPAIHIDAPGVGTHTASSGRQAIRMRNVEIRGTMRGAPAVEGSTKRPHSALVDSCVRLPNADPDRIVGVETKNVGYGADCAAGQGLTGQVGAVDSIPPIREVRVSPPAPGPGLRGFGALAGMGAIVAFLMGTLVPALRERVGR